MRVVVSGSHGFIGSPLVRSLQQDGHEIVRLVRGDPDGPGQVRWDPHSGTVDLDGLRAAGQIDAAVNLAGGGVGDHRWTESYKREIRDSRVLGTRTLVRALTSLDPVPKVLVSGSAIGFYGERGDEVLTEDSPHGAGFLSSVVREWEAEAHAAASAGIRVATVRSGLVMAAKGGAFGPLMLLTKFGLGGPLGTGRQWWSWISLEDEVRAIRFLLDHDVSGPVNLTGPEPARNREVAHALGRALKRPALLPAPAFALRIVLGEFAGEVLVSQRVEPAKLADAGFTFTHDTLDATAHWLAHQPAS